LTETVKKDEGTAAPPGNFLILFLLNISLAPFNRRMTRPRP